MCLNFFLPVLEASTEIDYLFLKIWRQDKLIWDFLTFKDTGSWNQLEWTNSFGSYCSKNGENISRSWYTRCLLFSEGKVQITLREYKFYKFFLKWIQIANQKQIHLAHIAQGMVKTWYTWCLLLSERKVQFIMINTKLPNMKYYDSSAYFYKFFQWIKIVKSRQLIWKNLYCSFAQRMVKTFQDRDIPDVYSLAKEK